MIKKCLISVLLILWAYNSVFAANFELSIKEKQWLGKLPPLRVGVSNSWLPINFKGDDATHQGIASDYMKLVSKKLGLTLESTFGTWQELQIKIKAGEIDLLPSVAFSKEKLAYLDFTEPYLSMPTIIATRIDAPHYPNIGNLKEVIVGVGENVAVQARLKRDYPEITTRVYATIEDAVIALDSGEIDALVTNATVYTYFQNKYQLKTSIHINNTTQYTDKIAIGVRHELAPLVPLLNRALADISDDEHDLIMDKWANLNIHHHHIDWTLAWQLALPVAIFVLLIFYSNRKMAAEIVKRKENEKKIESQQKLLDMTGKMAHIGGWELCLDTNRLTWTDEIYNIFEVGDDFTPTVEKGLNFFTPASKVLIEKALQSAMTTGEPYDLELEVKTAQGNQRWVHTMGQALREGSTVVRILGSFQDITERKQSEEALRRSEERFLLAMKASNDGLFDWNLESNDIYYSPAWKNMLGYEDHELPNDFSIWEKTTDPEDVKKSWELQQKLISKQIDRFVMEFKMKHKNGHWVDILSRAEAIFNDDGKAIRMIGTHTDITERKQAEAEREKLQSQLNQAQKMEAIGTMAGGIAHDFNNLLSIIIGNIDIVQHKQNSGTSTEENVAHIKNATHRAKKLVAQILAFGRQEKPDLVSIDLVKAVTESLKLLRSTTPVSIEIMSTFADEAIVVNADTTQLQQVILNLSSNAAHAMADKGLLTVAVRKIELTSADIPKAGNPEPGPYAKISVSDTGTGMDKQTLERIFDPFFTTKEVGIGTGMGLSVIHGIVERHGGFITVDSTVGAGSTFHIFLPVINQNVGIKQTDKEPPLPTGTERILFVDDEESIAYTCNELLEYQGYTVTSVTSGIEALDLFKANPDAFDLVITDQTMPVMTGAELATELLKIRPDIHIILCSGYSARVSEEDAKGIGIREFCMKPMDMKKLATVTRKVLDEEAS